VKKAARIQEGRHQVLSFSHEVFHLAIELQEGEEHSIYLKKRQIVKTKECLP